MLDFNWKYKDYELRAIPEGLVRLSDGDINHTIELIKWVTRPDGRKYCFTIAYWKLDREGYVLTIIGDRIFTDIVDSDLVEIWTQMKIAQKILEDFDLDNVFEEFYLIEDE